MSEKPDPRVRTRPSPSQRTHCGWIAAAAILIVVPAARPASGEDPGIGCGTWTLPFASDPSPPNSPPPEGGVAHGQAVRGFVAFRDAADQCFTLCLAGQELGSFTAAIGGFLRAPGEDWTPITVSPLGAGITAVLVDEDDRGAERLIVAGSFQSIDGVEAPGVAVRDGGMWKPIAGSPPGTPLPAAARALARLFAGDARSGATLVAAGTFAEALGSSVVHLTREGWAPLGTLDGEVNDLATVEHAPGITLLYAGGASLSSKGEPLGSIAAWNGTDWEGVPLPPDSAPESAVAVLASGQGSLAGMLYVGLYSARDSLRAWDGATWSVPGGGVHGGSVRMLSVVDDGLGEGPVLHVGGSINVAGGVQVERLARWNGRFWNAIGDGTWGSLDEMVEIAGVLPGSVIGAPGALVAGLAFGSAHGSFNLDAAVRLHVPCPDPRPGPFGRCRYAIELPPFDVPVVISSWNADGSGTGRFDGPIHIAGRWIRFNGVTTVLPSIVLPRSVNGAGLAVGRINSPPNPGAAPGRSWSIDVTTGVEEVWGSSTPNLDLGAVRVLDDGRIFGTDQDPESEATTGYERLDGVSTFFAPATPGSGDVLLNDVNVFGDAVGSVAQANVHAPWHLVRGVAEPLPLPPGFTTGRANGISAGGVITGLIGTTPASSLTKRGARWSGGDVEVLQPLAGHRSSVAWNVSDCGTCIGWSSPGSGERAVIWNLAHGSAASFLGRCVDWRYSNSFGSTGIVNDEGTIIVHGDDFPTRAALLVPQMPPSGDVDGDCVAGPSDLMLVLIEFGRPDGPADLNDDGIVDGVDLGIVLSNW